MTSPIPSPDTAQGMKPRKPPNWQASRRDFEQWLRACGAEPLGAKKDEFMRFRAHGILCIVYEPNRKGRRSCVPELAREAYDAWQARRSLNLTNLKNDPDVERWHAVGIALIALGARAKAGDILNIASEAAVLCIPPARLIRSLQAQGVCVPEPEA